MFYLEYLVVIFIRKNDTYKYRKIIFIILKTYKKGKAGGTGKAFDWNLAINIKKIGTPVILAGGLGPFNIEEAISHVKPYAVDINSGIEESPGKKSRILMKELFERLNRHRKLEREKII